MESPKKQKKKKKLWKDLSVAVTVKFTIPQTITLANSPFILEKGGHVIFLGGVGDVMTVAVGQVLPGMGGKLGGVVPGRL